MNSPQQLRLIDPGVPYDQDNPNSYRPPNAIEPPQIPSSTDALNTIEQHFASLGELPASIMETPERIPPRRNRFVKVAKLVCAFAVTTTLVIPTAFKSITSIEAVGYDCPDTSNEPSLSESIHNEEDLEIIRTKVADMNFGIERSDYERLREQLTNAQNLGDVQTVLQSSLSPYEISAHLGEMPRTEIGIFHHDNLFLKHRPELLTLDEAKASANEFMLGLSRIPRSFLEQLRGFGFYLTHAPNDEGEVGGLYVRGLWVADKSIVISTSFPDKVADITAHEVGHALQRIQCGDDLTKNMASGATDPVFTNTNPADFQYDKDLKLRTDAQEKNISTSYGASSYIEDYAEMAESILSGQYKVDPQKPSTVAQKQKILIRRFAQFEPDFEAYSIYLDYIGKRDFPRDTARAHSLSTECSDKPSFTLGRTQSAEGIAINAGRYQGLTRYGDFVVFRLGAVTPMIEHAPERFQFGWERPVPETDTSKRYDIGRAVFSDLHKKDYLRPGDNHFTVGDSGSKTLGNFVATCSVLEITYP